MPDRYDTSGNPEGQYQPGSDHQVLLNKLGITDPQEMENIEFDYLVHFQSALFDELAIDQKISTNDLCDWHRRWLGPVYAWAGNYRTVTMSKDGFPFAAVPQLPNLILKLDQEYLQKYTPCDEMKRDELVHVMALQAGMPALDFEQIEQDKGRYIEAIHAGHAGDYAPMRLIFSDVLDFSLQQASQNENNE